MYSYQVLVSNITQASVGRMNVKLNDDSLEEMDGLEYLGSQVTADG